jgi:hypothetical protein
MTVPENSSCESIDHQWATEDFSLCSAWMSADHESVVRVRDVMNQLEDTGFVVDLGHGTIDDVDAPVAEDTYVEMDLLHGPSGGVRMVVAIQNTVKI